MMTKRNMNKPEIKFHSIMQMNMNMRMLTMKKLAMMKYFMVEGKKAKKRRKAKKRKTMMKKKKIGKKIGKKNIMRISTVRPLKIPALFFEKCWIWIPRSLSRKKPVVFHYIQRLVRPPINDNLLF